MCGGGCQFLIKCVMLDFKAGMGIGEFKVFCKESRSSDASNE